MDSRLRGNDTEEVGNDNERTRENLITKILRRSRFPQDDRVFTVY
jgi:hypothetical protein